MALGFHWSYEASSTNPFHWLGMGIRLALLCGLPPPWLFWPRRSGLLCLSPVRICFWQKTKLGLSSLLTVKISPVQGMGIFWQYGACDGSGSSGIGHCKCLEGHLRLRLGHPVPSGTHCHLLLLYVFTTPPIDFLSQFANFVCWNLELLRGLAQGYWN